MNNNSNGSTQKIVVGIIATIFTGVVLALMNALWETGVSVGEAKGRVDGLEDKIKVNAISIEKIEDKIDEIFDYIRKIERNRQG